MNIILRSSRSSKQRNNHEVPCNQNFCMKFSKTPDSKNIIATLRIVTIEKPELTFLLYHNSMHNVSSDK